MNAEDKRRNAYYLRTYGITLKDYNSLRRKQKYCCGICKRHEKELTQRLHVDHDHVSLEVRGLLCNFCNSRFLGRHRNPDLFLAAYKYLKKGTGWFVPDKKKKRRRKK